MITSMTQAALIVVIGALLAAGVQAQSGADIRGTVVVGSGQAIPNVEIRLLGTAYRATSDAAGYFSLENIPSGDYVIVFSALGYWAVNTALHLENSETKEFKVILNAQGLGRVDTVSVQPGLLEESSRDAPSVFSLSGSDVRKLSSGLFDDPLRALHAFPGISSDDDFEARFSLRGADFSRIGVYMDGILLHNPFHTVQTTGASASITAFNSDLIDELNLYKGAYPVSFGDRSAGVVDIRTRDGASDRYSFRVSASLASASLMATGPLGRLNKCSWIGGVRKSYLQYLMTSISDPSLASGIVDGQGRLSCNITPKNAISLNAIASYTDLQRSSIAYKLGINSLMLAGNHFAFTDLAWRFTPNDKLLISNRTAWTNETSNEQNPLQAPLGSDKYVERVWDSRVSWMWNAHNPLDAGINVREMHDFGYGGDYDRQGTLQVLDRYRGSGLLSGAFVKQSWSLLENRVAMSAGVRWDHHSLNNITASSPQVSLTFTPWWSTHVQLGWAQNAQYPEISEFTSTLGRTTLLPMRSTHLIGAVEQQIGRHSRLRAEVYDRQDRDLLYQPFYDPRLVNGQVFVPPIHPTFENSLGGYARGVEVFFQRQGAGRLMGWVSYAYGRTRLHDGATNLSFPSRWDQTHTANAYGNYRLWPTVNISLRWSYGSGFPIPGFLETKNSLYFLSTDPNRLRLAPYQRVDLRANKVWTRAHWKTTVYAEVMNVTDKTNYRFDSFNGYNISTGRAFITLDKLFPVLPSIGIAVER